MWGVKQSLSNLANKRVLSYILTRFFGDSSGYFFLFWLPEYLMTSKTFTLLGTLGWIPFFWNDIGTLVGGYASSWLVQRGQQPLRLALLKPGRSTTPFPPDRISPDTRELFF